MGHHGSRKSQLLSATRHRGDRASGLHGWPEWTKKKKASIRIFFFFLHRFARIGSRKGREHFKAQIVLGWNSTLNAHTQGCICPHSINRYNSMPGSPGCCIQPPIAVDGWRCLYAAMRRYLCKVPHAHTPYVLNAHYLYSWQYIKHMCHSCQADCWLLGGGDSSGCKGDRPTRRLPRHVCRALLSHLWAQNFHQMNTRRFWVPMTLTRPLGPGNKLMDHGCLI